MQNQCRFMKPPAPVSRAKFDYVALAPGNLVPYIKRWHQLAGELPQDELVIVLPENDSKQRKTLSTVAELLKKSGHHVHVVQENELIPPRFGEVVQESLGI